MFEGMLRYCIDNVESRNWFLLSVGSGCGVFSKTEPYGSYFG
jgi:hypothetical protein